MQHTLTHSLTTYNAPALLLLLSSQLRGWLVGRVQVRRLSQHRLRRWQAAVTVQSAARAAFARGRCSSLRTARLRRWADAAAEMYRGLTAEDDALPRSALGAELLREVIRPPLLTPKVNSSPPQSSGAPADCFCESLLRAGGGCGGRGGRELAEALAPRMGVAPPGCPAALDVDWGEWGAKLTLEFPPEAVEIVV